MRLPRSRGLRLSLGLGVLLTAAAAAAALFFYLAILRDLPDLERVEDYRDVTWLSSHVLDRHGRPIGEFAEERRRLTPIGEIPRAMIQAIVAGEDDAFFEHQGLDYASILRAMWANLRAGRTTQGASTITQQVAKSLLLSPERSYRRKLREAVLARRIESRLTKHEILFLYLNQIYFGSGAYGIAEAARTYFGKDVSELTVSECALLAGLPQRPSEYSPLANPDAAERRRRYVLRRMLEVGFLEAPEHAAALADAPELAGRRELEDFALSGYFTEEVRRYLFERLGGDTVLRGGLTIETTLDLDLQRAGNEAVGEGLRALDRRLGYRGPERRVEGEAIPALRVELATQNELAEPAAGDQPPGAPAATPGAAEAPATPDAPAPHPLRALPADAVLHGVVVSVDRKAQSARVAFAPDVEAVVQLDDVAWARKPDPARRPYEVSSIAGVFRVGDVTTFRVLADDADAEPAPGADSTPPRVTIAQEPEVQGALLSLDVESGDVLALVGGYDFEASEFNRALQARRQPGSAFKPIVYAAALEGDYSPVSTLWDRPFVSSDPESGFDWKPRNYGRRFLGQITMREALARSINNATIHLAKDIGIRRVIEQARRLGIESELDADLSLALGSSSISLLELVRAYATFAAQGRLPRARFITRVLDGRGEVLLADVALGDPATPAEAEPDAVEPTPESDEGAEPAEPPAVAAADTPSNGEHGAGALAPEAAPDGVGAGPPEAEGDAADPRDSIAYVPPGHVLSPSLAYLMTDMLQGVVADPRGTGGRARVLGRPVAGKTGTTNEQADAWFLGFSPEIATGVWVGFDQRRVLGRGETGSVAALPIWIDFMREALRDRPVRDFPVPPRIVFARIDRATGLLAGASSQNAYFQAFYNGTEPTRSAIQAREALEADRLLRLDPF